MYALIAGAAVRERESDELVRGGSGGRKGRPLCGEDWERTAKHDRRLNVTRKTRSCHNRDNRERDRCRSLAIEWSVQVGFCEGGKRNTPRISLIIHSRAGIVWLIGKR